MKKFTLYQCIIACFLTMFKLSIIQFIIDALLGYGIYIRVRNGESFQVVMSDVGMIIGLMTLAFGFGGGYYGYLHQKEILNKDTDDE